MKIFQAQPRKNVCQGSEITKWAGWNKINIFNNNVPIFSSNLLPLITLNKLAKQIN